MPVSFFVTVKKIPKGISLKAAKVYLTLCFRVWSLGSITLACCEEKYNLEQAMGKHSHVIAAGKQKRKKGRGIAPL